MNIPSIIRGRLLPLIAAVGLLIGLPLTGVSIASAATTPSGSITGIVTNSSGAPIAGVLVEVFIPGVAGGTLPANATSSAAGTYTVPSLAPGSYTVAFEPAGWTGATPTTYAQEWFKSVAVSAGAATTQNAVLPIGGSITGIVTNSSGTPIANEFVVIISGVGGSTANGFANSSSIGSYSIYGLAPGSYTVQFGLSYGSPNPSNYSAFQTVTVAVSAGAATTQNAVLPIGGSITGIVTNSSGTPIAGVCLDANKNAAPGAFSSWGSGESAADGTYTMLALAPGSYTVLVDPTCGGNSTSAFVQKTFASVTVTSNGTTTLNATLDVPTVNPTLRVIGVTHVGTSSLVKIIGTTFSGTPKTIISSARYTTIKLVRNGGTYLLVRVTAGAKSPRGVHTFTITLSDGTKLTAKYTQLARHQTPSPSRVATDTVTFNAEGGSLVGVAMFGPDGSTITLPVAPTYSGHTFDGWFTAPVGGARATSPYTLTGSLTLYAQWTMTAPALPAVFQGMPTYNWAGYVLPSTNNSVNSVSGSWTVPTLNCSNTPNGAAWEWVGLNGASLGTGAQPPLIQTGVGSFCADGSQINDGWAEVVPADPNYAYVFSNFNVSPGDKMAAKVCLGTNNQWVTLIQDLTTGLEGAMVTGSSGGELFVATISNGALLGSMQSSAPAYQYAGVLSAEWIVEAPTSGSGIMALANYGTVTFSNLQTNLSQLSLTPSNAYEIVNQSGVAFTAESSVVNGSFTVTYTGP